MGDFKRGGEKRFGGHGGGFGRRGGFGGGRDRGPVTIHQAICDQCGKPCEVPFRPTSGKPVYCNACFGGKKETGNRGGDRFPQKSYDSYKAPLKPDFGGDISKGNNDGLKKQLEILNVNMDRLIKAIEAMVPAVKAKKSVKKVSKK
ncbi:MAG: hypothetical protein Q8N16_02435 [bacterium]|nr:hypothetical protein [bacterium]